MWCGVVRCGVRCGVVRCGDLPSRGDREPGEDEMRAVLCAVTGIAGQHSTGGVQSAASLMFGWILPATPDSDGL